MEKEHGNYYLGFIYIGKLGIMDKKMEAAAKLFLGQLGFRVWGFRGV